MQSTPFTNPQAPACITDPHLWVENYTDYLYKIAINRVSDKDQAMDLVQDTFLAAFEKSDRFEGRSSEKTWLTRILLNKVMDSYRRESFERSKQEQILNSILYLDNEATNEERLIGKEFVHLLDRFLLRLPELWSSVYKMKYLDNQPTEMICARLSISPSNFWTITHRSKLQLRAYFQKTYLN